MATFISGLTDSVGDVPMYQPDFSFLERMLRRKDQMYEQGFSEVQKAYNNVLNAPLTNPQNISIREQYIHSAQQKLKDISSVDLSRPENIAEAKKVFAPFWEDKDLAADAARTKIMNDAIQRGYDFLNSADEKERNKFWMTGIEYIQNGLKELSRANRGDGSIQRVTPRRYIPAYDVMGFLKERAGKDGLKIVQSNASPSGYKIVRTNGEETRILFESWVKQQLQGNQSAMDTFRVQGTVNFEARVNQYLESGLDLNSSRDMVAKDYIIQQRDHYQKALDNLTHELPKLKSETEALYKYLNDTYGGYVPQDAQGIEKLRKYEELSNLMKQYDSQKEEYTKIVADYSNPASEKYQGDYLTMMNNGESYFAQKHRDDFIRGAAQALMIENNKLEYELDPGYKLNTEVGLEMAKLRQQMAIATMKTAEDYYADDLRAAGNSSSGAGTRSRSAQETIDTPIPMGPSVKQTDNVTAYQRMVGVMKEKTDEFTSNGLSIVRNLSADNMNFKVSDRFLKNLESAIKTGKFNSADMPALNEELTKLVKEGVLPYNREGWRNPSAIYSGLMNYAGSYYKNLGSAIRPEVLGKLMKQDRVAKEFYELKDFVNKAQQEVKNNPSLAHLYRNGEFISQQEYLKERTGFSSPEEIDAYYDAQERSGLYGGQALGALAVARKTAHSNFKTLVKNYEKEKTEVDSKLGEILTPYLQNEGAYLGQTVRIAGDRSQQIAQQVLGDDNMRGQIVTRDGILPANVTLLEQNGAEREEVQRVVDFIRRNPQDYVVSTDLSKIGSSGAPSVVLNLDIAKLQTNLGKESRVSESTMKALGANGIELIAKTPGLIPEIQSGFGQGVFDAKLFNEYGSAQASEFLRNIGFDYRITRDESDNKYLITIKHPSIENGQEVTREQVISVPITSPISELESELLNKIYTIQQNNYRIRQRQQQTQGIFENSSSSQPAMRLDEYLKSIQ